MQPILYSYRRCPYAIRARMALKLANIQVEMREVSLRNKPQQMLQISPKATVPVLLLPDGTVIDESLEIMFFALSEHTLGAHINTASRALILENDHEFKRALDAYKYPERNKLKTQVEHRAEGEHFLQKLESLLQHNQYLQGQQFELVDIAIFPFIRQFASVDALWWETAPYPRLRHWLAYWQTSEIFTSVMEKQPTYLT
jgi:glutathione S-transferase